MCYRYPPCRALSDTHFSLAVAYIYNASEKDTGVVDPIDEKKKALVHYKKAHEVTETTMALFLLTELCFRS